MNNVTIWDIPHKKDTYNVRLEDNPLTKVVGTIEKTEKGFQYFAGGKKKHASAIYPTLLELKNELSNV